MSEPLASHRGGAVRSGRHPADLRRGAARVSHAARSSTSRRFRRVAASLEDPDFANYVSERITDAVIKAKLRPDGPQAGAGRDRPRWWWLRRRSAPRCAAAPAPRTTRSCPAPARRSSSASGRRAWSLEQHGGVPSGAREQDPPKVSAVIGEIGSLPGGQRALRLVQIARPFAGRRRGIPAARHRPVRGRSLALRRAPHGDPAHRGRARPARPCARDPRPLRWLRRRPARPARREQPRSARWRARFLGGLLPWAIGLGCAGLVLASASASFLGAHPARPLERWTAGLDDRAQERMRVRLARGLVGASLGAALLIAPLAVAHRRRVAGRAGGGVRRTARGLRRAPSTCCPRSKPGSSSTRGAG